MRLLRNMYSSDLVAIATAATSLALPPPVYGLVPPSWSPGGVVPPNGGVTTPYGGVIPEFELEVWTDSAAVSVTEAVLYGATLYAYTFGDITVTPTVVKATLALTGHTSTHLDNTIRAKVPGFGGNGFTFATAQMAGAGVGILTHVGNAYLFTFENGVTTQGNMNTAIAASSDLEVATAGTTATVMATGTDVFSAVALAGGSAVMDATAHGLETGDGSVFQTAGTSFPTGLDGVTPYWIIRTGADTFELAASLTDAMSGIPVDFSSAGVGAQKTVAKAATQRVHWDTHDGLLGLAGDGAISLTNQVGYRKIVPHSPRVFAYALVATLDTGAVSAAIVPRVDRE